MIPKLIDLSALTPWPVLPQGIHLATLADINARFATTPHRTKLFNGFERVVTNLVYAGCSEIYLDGSFVTDAPIPSDFDGCWNPTAVDIQLVDPVLLDFKNNRAAQKQKFYGEMFFSNFASSAAGTLYLDFFQGCKHSGLPKGILQVDLT